MLPDHLLALGKGGGISSINPTDCRSVIPLFPPVTMASDKIVFLTNWYAAELFLPAFLI